MSFFKKVFVFLIRNKVKTFVLFIILFLSLHLISFSVIMTQAVKELNRIAKEKTAIVASLAMKEDSSSLMHTVPLDVIEKIGVLDSVDFFDYETGGPIALSADETGSNNTRPDAFFKAVQDLDLLDLKINFIDIQQGNKDHPFESILESRATVLVPETLFVDNNWSMGETISLTFNPFAVEKEIIKTFDFAIVGTFLVSDHMALLAEQDVNIKNDFEKLQKTFYFPFSNYKMIQPDIEPNITTQSIFPGSVHFFLNSVDDYDSFLLDSETILNQANLSQFEIISTYTDFEQVQTTIQSLNHVIKIFSIVSVVITWFVMSLTFFLFLRGRQNEFGLYLALGEKKLKLVAQILLQMICVAVIATSCVLFTGQSLSAYVRDKLVSIQESTQETEEPKIIKTNRYNDPIFSLYKKQIDAIDISQSLKQGMQLDLNYIGYFYAFSILTTLLSVSFPMFYTVNSNPKKLLM